MVESRNQAFFSDGTNHFQYSPTTGTQNWGIAAPTTGGVLSAAYLDTTCTAGAGTLAITNGSYTVTGTSTKFTTTFNVADLFYTDGIVCTVESIQSDTQLTITTAWTMPTASGLTYLVGGIALDEGRRYYCVYQNASNLSTSDLSPLFTAANTGVSGDTTLTVLVPPTAMPWNPLANVAYPCGLSDGTYYTVSNLTLVAGAEIEFTYVSGTAAKDSKSTLVGAGGDDAGPTGDSTITINGTTVYYPTHWMNDDTLSRMSLCGAFTNSSGVILETLPIGAGAVFTVPVGATALTLGVNDSQYSDNVGSGYKIMIVQSTGTAAQPSDSSGPLVFGRVTLKSIPVSSDPQVSTKLILATADGGDETTLYVLVSLANNVTTYVDAMSENDLLQQNTALETETDGTEIGCTDNTPPPADGILPTKHGDRLALVSGNQFLYVSKSLAEVTTSTGYVAGLWEACWPVANSVNISIGTETARGLCSNGTTLFIGTERHIHTMSGNDPSNFTDPEITFNAVGIVNQDVWKSIFLEGTPSGMMWLTPDLRVILSDFNVYADVGRPIQDVLNTINTAAVQSSFAIATTQAPYAWYMLFVPTGTATAPNTVCLYDVQSKQWFVWYLYDTFTTGLLHINAAGIPQIILTRSDATFWLLSSAVSTDNGNVIPTTIQTSWLGGATLKQRKLLNELELVAPSVNLQVSVDGTLDGQTIHNIFSNIVPVQSPFGQYKVYFYGYPTPYKHYRLTFTDSGSSTTSNVLLAGFALEECFFNDL
jgi:hypothetical protein